MADKKISALTSATTPLAGTEVLPIVQSSATVKVAVSNLTAGRSFDALGMTLTSTDAGVAAAPTLDLYRDSASPAASDTLGEIKFNGEDSAGNKQQYALIHAAIISPTSTSEGGQLHFETTTLGSSTEKMRIGTSGDVTLLTGNLVIGTANKGIDFSITSSGTGTMTSELLNDYEEGTWTPSVGGTATYTARTGKYTKVGRLVTVIGHIQINVLGTGLTTTLSGLPFNNSDLTPISVGYWANLAVNVIYITGYIGAAGSTILFVSGTTSSGTANNAIALFGNSADIYFSATYEVYA